MNNVTIFVKLHLCVKILRKSKILLYSFVCFEQNLFNNLSMRVLSIIIKYKYTNQITEVTLSSSDKSI